MFLLSRFRAPRRGESPIVGDGPPPHPFHRPPAQSRLEVKSSLTSDLNHTSLTQYYAQVTRDLRSSLPSTCRWLGPADIALTREHPIASGQLANVYEATHDGRPVMLKSYRCYVSKFDVAQIVARFSNEAQVCALLCRRDVETMPLVGVYSTEMHPFGLVYEYMDGLDLRQYQKNKPNAERLKLLAGVAQCLGRMHDLGVVHGHLQTTNILIDRDGTVRISGLGNASILPDSIAGIARGTISNDRLSRGHAPELACPGMLPNSAKSTYPTKASDTYAFGVMALEVLTGRLPFFGMTEVAATYLMLNGVRPPRPHHQEISDQVWYMIERCWHSVPSKRMSIGEVANLLETELQRESDFCALPRA